MIRKNKKFIDPRYFMNEKMECINEAQETGAGYGAMARAMSAANPMRSPYGEEPEEEEAEDPREALRDRTYDNLDEHAAGFWSWASDADYDAWNAIELWHMSIEELKEKLVAFAEKHAGIDGKIAREVVVV